jgi:hypothetical protein
MRAMTIAAAFVLIVLFMRRPIATLIATALILIELAFLARHQGRRLICAIRGHLPHMAEFDDGSGHREWCPRCQRHWFVEHGVVVQEWMPMS